MKPTKQWLAIYTRPRWEKKVAERLTRSKIEAYCPLMNVLKQWADRKKLVLEPLFTSYVFVHISDGERVLVKETDGLINFVHWLGKPAIIRDEEIEIIKKTLHQYKNIKLERINVNINDNVKITSGAFIHNEGKVIEVQPKSVKVYLPSLGYLMIVEKPNVEIINEFENKHRLVS